MRIIGGRGTEKSGDSSRLGRLQWRRARADDIISLKPRPPLPILPQGAFYLADQFVREHAPGLSILTSIYGFRRSAVQNSGLTKNGPRRSDRYCC